MKARVHLGECKLCGKKENLTFEHVPPQTAFNSFPVKMYAFDQAIQILSGAGGRKPWDFDGLYGTINQRGSGGYYLCRQCNNNTGSWYMSEYVKLSQIIHSMIIDNKFLPGSIYNFEIISMYPLRLFKAIMTMFCDINNNCFGDEQLKNYLLEKESTDLDLNKYKVYLTLVTPQMRRIQGYAAMANLLQKEPVGLTEVASYPLGCILCIDKPDWYIPTGILINDWATYTYDDKCNLQFVGIPYLDINSQFPGDYRTKDDSIKCMENTKKVMESKNV